MSNNELIRYLVQKGYEWIVSQRNLYIVTAQELSEQDRTSLQPYFEPKILGLAKRELVDYIENPPFYPEVMKLGIPNAIDFTQMAGITFIDCILISRRISHNQRSWTSLLFHEMVHVVQYYLLGAQRFAELYVIGWAQNGFDYGRIPLERQAYDLQRRFDQGGSVFSVVQLLNQQFGHVS
ncbi:MAG: hypothetical protein COZ37_02435 [bacterium (Candidatus Ratteibacteria) CG_4_10_14_3_um_filter_41_18]|uniref:DUF4157 domain-containing protein n=1 Tax=bacterium (Candidatus Ratteibacteria) CG_4_10_14_3_um_filter_41_18 TaxID=2014287 RepID=A0A2M7M448_9BACT|nr:MAG: hypothetical protein COZ37_02435 [bacterium (Candidatus Ratteibacteria) CG_4_10_14_3_um_filter_41_18]